MILNQASDIKYGSVDVQKVYAGTTLVWERSSAYVKLIVLDSSYNETDTVYTFKTASDAKTKLDEDTSVNYKMICHDVELANNQFSSQSNLIKVQLTGDNLTLGDSTFGYCSNMKEILFPSNLKTISSGVCSGCSALTSVSLPDNVVEIAGGAFYSCSSLTSITFPDTLQFIKANGFGWCTSLTGTLNLKNITTLGNSAFYKCAITDVYAPNLETLGVGTFYVGSSIQGAYIPNIQSIGESAFEGCSKLTSVTTGASLSTIGNYAFNSCTSLTELDFSTAQFTSLSDMTFYNCPLVTLKLPATYDYTSHTICSSFLTTLEYLHIGKTDWAYETEQGDYYQWFSSFTALKTLSLGENVVALPYGLLYENSTITTLDMSNSGVEKLSNYVCYKATALGDVTVPDCCTVLGSCLFHSCVFSEFTIPDSVTEIGEWAFTGCKSLKSIVIPDSVVTVATGLFYACTALTTATISNSLATMPDAMFAYCSALSDVTIPDSVVTISTRVFLSTALTSITIPSGVTSIGSTAFKSCTNLTAIYVDQTEGALSGSPWGATNATVTWKT